MLLLSDEMTLCDANDDVVGDILNGSLTENATAWLDCNDTVAINITPTKTQHRMADVLGTLASASRDDAVRHIIFLDVRRRCSSLGRLLLIRA